MNQLKIERNRKIKRAVIEEVRKGLLVTEAFHVVAERWYLSAKSIERIYYETIMP